MGNTKQRGKSRKKTAPAPPPAQQQQLAASKHNSNNGGVRADVGGSTTGGDIEILDTGCLVCGKDDDHGKLLLCEACSGEYHTYCLIPKLDAVPKSAWYCARCDPNEVDFDEQLEQAVAALPATVSARFGEICWAQGGVGYGWWPCCIYSPLWAHGPARSEARRHLGKRHLVYFLQCDGSPFAVLPEAKIVAWIAGLADNMHLGRAAKAYSKERYVSFQKAFQVAMIEYDEPISKRMEHHERIKSGNNKNAKQGQTAVSAVEKETKKDAKPEVSSDAKRKTSLEKSNSIVQKRAKRSNLASLSFGSVEATSQSETINKATLLAVAERLDSSANDCELVCTIWDQDDNNQHPGKSVQIGFVILPSQKTSTFSDARKLIVSEIDALGTDWKFYIPHLGPVSRRQENIFGALLPFFAKRQLQETDIGAGNAQNPLRLYVVKS